MQCHAMRLRPVFRRQSLSHSHSPFALYFALGPEGFAEAYPDDYARLSKERQVGRYFPWSAAFINVSFMLLDVLGIRDLRDSEASRSKVTYGFLASVGDGPWAVERAFVEQACEAMTEVDRVFVAEQATYFEFPRVRAAVFEELAGRVGHRAGLVSSASSGGKKQS